MNAYSLFGDSTTSPVSPLPRTSEDVTNFMIRRSRELVGELVKRRGREEPPFLAEELAPLQGIKDILKTDLKTDFGEIDAILLRKGDGYVIEVNTNHHPARQNFSCAHEIGHTFLHELDRLLNDQLLSLDNDEFRGTNPNNISKAKERLCNIAAAELLMPESVFRKYLSRFGVSANSIERLAYTFRVSIPTAAIRIAEVSIEPCIAIIWKPRQKTKSKGFIAKHMGKPIYIRDPSALLKAYNSHELVKSFKFFEIDNIKKRCLMESMGFSHGQTRYVISLVFPER